MEELREQIVSIVCSLADPLPTEEWCDGCVRWKNSVCCNPKVDQILAIPEIAALLALHEKADKVGGRLAVVDDKAELPRFIYFEASRYSYGLAQREMLQTGYVKEVK